MNVKHVETNIVFDFISEQKTFYSLWEKTHNVDDFKFTSGFKDDEGKELFEDDEIVVDHLPEKFSHIPNGLKWSITKYHNESHMLSDCGNWAIALRDMFEEVT
jgi:hypothetical protein